jgi:hypothetical protein
MKLNPCRAIALGFGHVESRKTAWLVFNAEQKFPKTRHEALMTLTEYLWSKFKYENSEGIQTIKIQDMKPCCRLYWYENKKDKPSNCGTCDTEYTFSVSFDKDDWCRFLKDLAHSDCDSYGEHECIDNPYGWNPWSYNFEVLPRQTLVISENADEILTRALFELHPSLQSEEENFEHTDYIGRDYLDMLNESTVFVHGSYKLPQEEDVVISTKEGKVITSKQNVFTETVILGYPNGAQETSVNGYITHIRYNTGDEIWLDHYDDEYHIVKIQTHDGLCLEPLEGKIE